jgi:hypothetical protein
MTASRCVVLVHVLVLSIIDTWREPTRTHVWPQGFPSWSVYCNQNIHGSLCLQAPEVQIYTIDL